MIGKIMAVGALTAFNTVVGVLGLGISLEGLLAPDPLDAKIDGLAGGINDDLEDIKTRLNEIGAGIEDLEDQIGQGFLVDFRTTLTTAFSEVERSYSRYKDELADNRNGVTASDVVVKTDEAVAGFLELITPLQIQTAVPGVAGAISTLDAKNMIEAVQFAVSLRLAVAQEYEDGAVGNQSIYGTLQDAQTAVNTILDGYEIYINSTDELFARSYNPVGTSSIREWTGDYLADVLIGYNASQGGGYNAGILALRARDDELLNQSEYRAVLLDAFSRENPYDSFARDVKTNRSVDYLNENRVEYQSSWRTTVINTDTDETEVNLRTLRYNDDTYAAAVRSLDAGLDKLENQARSKYLDQLDFENLRTVSTTFAELADGIDDVGTSAGDMLAGSEGNDLLTGLAGNDIINAGSDDDVVRGGSGNDMMRGEAGADVLDGGSGNDRAEGGEGNDVLYGGAGSDSLNGGTGEDQLLGGEGADFLNGGAGADIMAGGLGNDFYVVGSLLDEIEGEIAFSQGGGIDTVRTYINNYVQPDNIELLRITDLNSTQNFNATGNDAPGTLVGNAGNNVLTGRGGNDQINGNGGNDRLIGNTGRDTLVGGGGADTFVFTSISESRAGAANRDLINGFERGTDKIDLSAIDANLGLAGEGVFDFIGNARFDGDGAASAGQVRLQALGGANAVLVEADLRGDGVTDFQVFVNLTTVLSASDFIL